MTETASLIISTSTGFDPVLARFGTPLGWAVDNLEVLGSVGKLAFAAVGAVTTRLDKGSAKLSLVKLSVDNKLGRLARRCRARETSLRLAVNAAAAATHCVVAGRLVGVAAV